MLPEPLLTRDSAADVFKKIEGVLGGSTAMDWEPIALEEALIRIERLRSADFYLYYRHPVHEFKDRCSRVPKDTALQFLREQFHQERGEGVDVYLTPMDFSTVFAGNHDGGFFRAK